MSQNIDTLVYKTLRQVLTWHLFLVKIRILISSAYYYAILWALIWSSHCLHLLVQFHIN